MLKPAGHEPFTGGEPTQFTKFTTNEIFDFDYFTSTSQFAVISGTWNRDAILAKGFDKRIGAN